MDTGCMDKRPYSLGIPPGGTSRCGPRATEEHGQWVLHPYPLNIKGKELKIGGKVKGKGAWGVDKEGGEGYKGGWFENWGNANGKFGGGIG